MFLKISFVWISLFCAVYADSHYIARGSLVGGIADIKLHHRETSETYTTRLVISATGLAKTLSGNQKEIHISKGKVRHNEYYAGEYVVTKWHKNTKYLKRYLFDYLHKKIRKFSTKWKNGKQVYSKKETLRYFSHNDMLTLYHNILHFKKRHKRGKYAITLAGAENHGGKVTFGFANGQDMKGADTLTLDINNSAFAKGKGRLLFEIGSDSSVITGELRGVKLLGTVTLKRLQ